MTNNFANLISSTQEKINKKQFPINIHIDEVYNKIEKIPDGFLENSIKLFCLCVQELRIDKDICINMDIELISENKILRGCPKNLHDLKQIIEVSGMPEIIIDQRQYIQTGIAEIEYYLCPLPFTLKDIPEGCRQMYSEYRRNMNEEYDSWLSLIL